MTKANLEDNFLLKARIMQFIEWFNTLTEEQIEKFMQQVEEFKKTLKN